MSKLLVVRVRGLVGLNPKSRTTLELMNLRRSNNCVILDDTPVIKGMLKRIKDFCTWGEVSPDVMKALLVKRARLPGNKRLKLSDEELSAFVKEFFDGKKSLKDLGIKDYFRLSPPKKGFDRAGVKKPFTVGGALGYRAEKINDLVKRMI